jgi:hypothetical protein
MYTGEWCPSEVAHAQVLFAYFLALLGNLGWPMSLPRSLTLSTRSMALRIFWSGVALPRSKSATTDCVVLHLVARSFWVILGSIFCRAPEMQSPTVLPMVLGLMMSSERSTLVRRWPSPPPVWGCCQLKIAGWRGHGVRLVMMAHTGRPSTGWREATYRVGRAVLLLRAENSTTALSGVESTLAADDRLLLRLARSTDLAADLGDVVPVVRHCAGLMYLERSGEEVLESSGRIAMGSNEVLVACVEGK